MRQVLYQIRVTLEHSEPSVWRQVEVLSNTTLDALHDILQVAMGWDNEHLYQFIVEDTYYGDSELGTTGARQDASRVTIGNLFNRAKKRMTYEYDFGDGWEHEVFIEKIRPLPEGEDTFYPRCTAGENTCPPEDIGGIFGYFEYLSALKDKNAPSHQEAVSILGEDYDPSVFELDFVNHQLKELFS